MYGNIHRFFIQAMMCRKITPWDDACELLKKIIGSVPDEGENESLQSVIDEINNRIRDLKMLLKDVICEVTKRRYCVLIISVNSHVSRLCSSYTANEMQLFNKIMEEIITSKTGCAYRNTCINLNAKLQETMTKSNAESVIKRFLGDKWLIEHEGGMIYLGVRCIAEMEPFIRNVYGEYVGNCPLCERLAIVGEKCNSCFSCVHFHCIDRYKSGKGENIRKCLTCGADWNDSYERSDESD